MEVRAWDAALTARATPHLLSLEVDGDCRNGACRSLRMHIGWVVFGAVVAVKVADVEEGARTAVTAQPLVLGGRRRASKMGWHRLRRNVGSAVHLSIDSHGACRPGPKVVPRHVESVCVLAGLLLARSSRELCGGSGGCCLLVLHVEFLVMLAWQKVPHWLSGQNIVEPAAGEPHPCKEVSRRRVVVRRYVVTLGALGKRTEDCATRCEGCDNKSCPEI